MATLEKKLSALQLRETIELIYTKKNWLQKDLARYLDVDQSVISKIGKQWESHWQVFWKLYPLCVELKLLPVEPPPTSTTKEIFEVLERRVQEELNLSPKAHTEFKQDLAVVMDFVDKHGSTRSKRVRGVPGKAKKAEPEPINIREADAVQAGEKGKKRH